MRQRRAQRHQTGFSCSAQVQGEQVEVVIETFSYEGFGLRCKRALLIGSEIVLDLPIVGANRAKIRWSLGGAAGGVFHAQLSDEAVSRITASAPKGEKPELPPEADDSAQRRGPLVSASNPFRT
jgi:hypothetical protein